MSQSDFGNLSSPLNGPDFFDNKLEPWRDAVHSNHSGSSRPSYAAAGLAWLDTTTNPWSIKWFTGSADIVMGKLNTSLNIFVPANGTLNNVTATTNPTVSNDGTQGYAIGSIWINTTTGAQYFATGVGTGAAVWVRVFDLGQTLANANLAAMAANTVKANATAGSATPTDVALTASTVLGRDSSGNIVALATSQLPGTATNDSANTGKIGEYLEAELAFGSATSLVSNTAKTVISLALTAGDWDVSGLAQFTSGGTTTSTLMEAAISLSANSVTAAGKNGSARLNSTGLGTNPGHWMPVGACRVSLSAPATVYLCANSTFATSTMSAYGHITARRRR